jgi:hypothetical protein
MEIAAIIAVSLIVGAWVGVALDVYIGDVDLSAGVADFTEPFMYYVTVPWDTVKRGARLLWTAISE